MRLLHDAIDADHFPLSPRVQTWRAILARLRPEPARPSPLAPLKVYAAAQIRRGQEATAGLGQIRDCKRGRDDG
jgi:hypothetical protein